MFPLGHLAFPTVRDAVGSFNLLPIVLSVIAIFVSVASIAFTSYLQYFQRPKLSLIFSERLVLWLGPKGEPVFTLGITVVNSGAKKRRNHADVW